MRSVSTRASCSSPSPHHYRKELLHHGIRIHARGWPSSRSARRALTEKIIPFEDECERNNGLCPESHASIKAAVLESGLQAINTPTELGGAGLTVLEQVVVQEELGKLTNALWDTVWRPANPLAHATARAARALSASRVPRRAARRRRNHRKPVPDRTSRRRRPPRRPTVTAAT